MVWEILGTRTNPFSVPKVGKKSNNVKYINNVIVHTIWIIQFHDQFLFYSDVVIDYWLWTVKAWKISPITWQSPCWNVPALVWSQKLFPGWEQSFDMIWFWKSAVCLLFCFFVKLVSRKKDLNKVLIYNTYLQPCEKSHITCSPAISTTNILFWMRFSDRKNHIPTTTYYYSQFPKRWWYNTINLPMKYILWI